MCGWSRTHRTRTHFLRAACRVDGRRALHAAIILPSHFYARLRYSTAGVAACALPILRVLPAHRTYTNTHAATLIWSTYLRLIRCLPLYAFTHLLSPAFSFGVVMVWMNVNIDSPCTVCRALTRGRTGEWWA